MSLHKLSAATGYLYLLRATAQGDLDGPVAPDLASYYSEKGETPGRWVGSGLVGLRESGGSIEAGHRVTEAHMQALFGEGIHPEADQIVQARVDEGMSAREALGTARLGRAFLNLASDTEFRQQLAIAYVQAARGKGGSEGLTEQDRAAVRDQVARTVFEQEHGRSVLDETELSAFLAQKMRPAAIGVAGFDLTFSPVKSVSTLWALGSPEVATTIREAHRDAVADVLTWLEADVARTRRGAGGVRITDIRGLIATEFEHRDSRAGDPDLHTHMAISNKVQDAADGSWLALDGATLYRATVAASERYNTRLEAILRDRLGVDFEPVQRDDGLREVREIVGIGPDLLRHWSTRRAAIEERRAVLAAEFLAQHGRVPTPLEAVELAQRATLETRGTKHEPHSEHDQRARWRDEASGVLGSPQQVDAMVQRALNPESRPGASIAVSPADAAERVVRTVSEHRACFAATHLRAEAERVARVEGVPWRDLDRWVDDVMRVALRVQSGDHDGLTVRLDQPSRQLETAGDTPAPVMRRDGTSVYERPMSALYTTPELLEAEEDLLGFAQLGGGRSVPSTAVDIALLESAANGRDLNDGQRAMVRALTGSDRRCQLVLAPAGTGKTTAMRVVTQAWQDSGGSVIALAPSASAGTVLGESIGVQGDTLANLTHAIAGGSQVPSWASDVDERSLVVIDEAGLAGTIELRDAVRWLIERGASVQLLGDDRQLASVAAGGVLRDIDREVGSVNLRAVVRFDSAGEAAASLAVREGDAAAVAWWVDNGRIHAGAQDAQIDDVVAAWDADRHAGRDAVMLATSRSHVRALNERARGRRIAAGEIDQSAPSVIARGDVRIGVGDCVVARRNDRRVRISASHWLKNGDRFTVVDVHEDGSISARHDATARHVRLPGEYVAQHVDLGYALTIHSSQGTTVDVSHTLLTGDEDRQALYVATSRGRQANHVYVPMSTDGSEHSVVKPEAIVPSTAVETVEAIVARDGAATSARTAKVRASDARTNLAHHVSVLEDARQVAVLDVVDPSVLERIDAGAESLCPGISHNGGWGALRSLLAEISLDGHDPLERLKAAHHSRELDTAVDVAAVLWWRLDGEGRHDVQGSRDPELGWLRPLPAAVRNHAQWGPYLQSRQRQIEQETDAVRGELTSELRRWTPRWAAGFGHQRGLVREVALWRVLHGVPESNLDALGPATGSVRQQRRKEQLEERVERAREHGRQDMVMWKAVADASDPRVSADPYWPVVGVVLDRARSRGEDPAALLAQALGERALPAERCGAALWWRLHELLGADVDAEGPTRLYPTWAQHLPDSVVQTLSTATDWPAFVALVEDTAAASNTDAGDVAAFLTPASSAAAEQSNTEADAAGERPESGPDPVGGDVGGDADEALARALLRLDQWVAADQAHDEPPVPESLDIDPDDVEWYLRHLTASDTPAPPTADEDEDQGVVEAAPSPTPEEQRLAAAVAEDSTEMIAGSGSALAQRIRNANAAAWQWWTSQYAGSAGQDLIQRRFGPVADRIDAGYAPASWDATVTALRAAGVSDEDLLAADLARYSRRGGLIDTYRGRVMLPIRDRDGAIVGFSGRRIDDTDARAPKWLNGSSNAAWTKGASLYGSDLAAAHPTAVVVLVEGVADALAVNAAGAGHYVAVAPLGTAFTPAQADQLSGREVCVALDDDSAGRRAARTAFRLLVDAGVRGPSTITLPEGADPADVLRVEGQAALRGRLETPRPLIEDLIEDACAQVMRQVADRPGAYVEERVHAARDLARLVVMCPPAQWVDLAAQCAADLDLAPETLSQIVNDAAAARVPDVVEDVPPAPTHAQQVHAALERLRRRHDGATPPGAAAPSSGARYGYPGYGGPAAGPATPDAPTGPSQRV